MASMRLTPWEEVRLLVFTAAELARRHRAAGLALNAPEAVALICDAMFEAARAGASYADVEAAARRAVSPDEVMPGVRELIEDVRLEVLLGDGTRLVVSGMEMMATDVNVCYVTTRDEEIEVEVAEMNPTDGDDVPKIFVLTKY
jgi:urease gamma subunit